MPTLTVITQIAAPIQRCFDLARDVETHTKTAAFTQERIVGGRTKGLLELGDTLTFEGVHFGIRQRLTAKIVEMNPPFSFADEMLSGAFKSMRHEHRFEEAEGVTTMTDTITWTSPYGVLGRIADLFVKPHLERFVLRRNANLKKIAEESAAN
jgi:ligand-binding SRPBCC domain-containing protein